MLLFNAACLDSIDSGKRRSITPVLFFLSAVVTSAAPLVTWLFLPLIVIALTLPALRRTGDWRRLIQPNLALIAFLLVALYIFLNATWAADPGAAARTAALFLTLVVLTFAANGAVDQLDEHQLRRAALAFAAGAFLGALFVLFEVLTHSAATRLAMNSIALLRPEQTTRHFVVSQGKVTWIRPSDLKHNAAILTFNLWPGLLVLRTIASGTRRALLMGLFFVAVAACVVLTQHRSSIVALCVSPLVFFLAWNWGRPVIRALAGLYCLAFVLVMPINFLAYNSDLQLANWLPSSFRARVIIWEYTAERVLDHPWLGIGAASTPAVREPVALAEKPEGYAYPRNTGRHAHDLFLQTWYELGAVGAILIALAGAVVAFRISLLPIETQPFAAASFAVFMSIAAFAWGIWQTWLMCAVGLSVLYLRTASSAAHAVRSDAANSDSVEARASGPLLQHR
ncbi:MAG: O-antigen ligase family protein [Methyloceanibacter sp.]